MARDLPGASEAILMAVVARVDGLEGTLTRQQKATDGLVKAVAALVQSVAKLPGSPGAAPPSGQPDWLAITDPAAAETLLAELADWHDRVATVLLGAVTQPCWPWHPAAVVSALSLRRQHKETYAAPSAAGVSDLLTRWVPAHATRLRRALADCSAHEHHEARLSWSVRLEQLPDLARWWATSRQGLPPGLLRRAA